MKVDIDKKFDVRLIDIETGEVVAEMQSISFHELAEENGYEHVYDDEYYSDLDDTHPCGCCTCCGCMCWMDEEKEDDENE